MALQRSYELPIGITCPVAYSKISDIKLTASELIATVETFANVEARTANKPIIDYQAYSLARIDAPSLTYCYDQLKTFAEFAGAIDV